MTVLPKRSLINGLPILKVALEHGRFPYPGSIKGIGLEYEPHPVMRLLGQGAEHKKRSSKLQLSKLMGLEDIANQAAGDRGVCHARKTPSDGLIYNEHLPSRPRMVSVGRQADIFQPKIYASKNRFRLNAFLFLSI